MPAAFMRASMMNIIDNSIYWLDVARRPTKRLWIATSRDLGGKAIVMGDNGPGFRDPPEFLLQPFMSRRPDGMGIGPSDPPGMTLACGR